MILNRSFKAAIISIVLTYVLDFCNKQELRVLKVGKTKFFLGKGLSRHRPNADGAMEFDANYFLIHFANYDLCEWLLKYGSHKLAPKSVLKFKLACSDTNDRFLYDKFKQILNDFNFATGPFVHYVLIRCVG